MVKTVWTQFRMNEHLAEQVKKAAEARGMNHSEFYRYVLTLFFDQHTDNGLRGANSAIAEPRATYEA